MLKKPEAGQSLSPSSPRGRWRTDHFPDQPHFLDGPKAQAEVWGNLQVKKPARQQRELLILLVLLLAQKILSE
jgi:hypothetical protein